jgi:ribonuclease P protein component
MTGAVWRVRRASTFAELRRHGRRVRSGPITVTWLPGPADEPPKVAFAIGRPIGNAVIRNRLRRRLRSLFAEQAPGLAPGTYLLGAAPAAATLDHGELRRTLSTALTDLTRIG